ncbi:MAG: LPS-assembly protein LptD [Thermoanaerobaculia bacterium]|nr:LPS-assembly protein LptD [Thermoanaerobaculia bacterium]
MMRTIRTFFLLAAVLWVVPAANPLLAEEPAQAPAADAPPTTPADEKPKDEKPKDERVTFSVKLTGMPGGGRAEGRAGAFEYQEGQYLIATGGVEVKYQDLKLTAERARIDIPTNRMTAEGEVVLDEGPQRLVGTTLEYDLATRTGRVTEATAFVAEPGYVFSGDEIAKIGEQTYTVADGIFTSCVDQKVPDWSLRMSSAEVTLGAYAKVKNARMRFKNVPMFYFPYILWPAKTERSSGFLVPKPGYSSRRGGYLGLAYFQTLGRSADTTFFADLFTEEYFGIGNEFRYQPSERTQGNFRAHLIMEPDTINDPKFRKEPLDNSWTQGDDRWKVQFSHVTNQLWGRFRGVINYEDYSDFDYLQDYERSVNLQTKSVIRSQGFLTANFGVSSLNILAEQTERINRGFVTTLRQLPEVEYRVRNAKLGSTPLYFSLLSSVNYFDIDRSAEPRGFQIDYGRADVFPTLSIPLSSLTWLSTKLDLSYRATFYSKSGNPDPNAPAAEGLEGGSLTRTYPQASLEVIGPSFSRIFDKPIGRFAKLKHIIEPRLNYLYIADLDDTLTEEMDPLERTSRIIQFDEVDRAFPANFAIFTISNRLLAKPKPQKKTEQPAEPDKAEVTKTAAEIDEEATEEQGTPAAEDGETVAADEEEEEEGAAFEIASFELSQAYSFDDDQPGQQSSGKRPVLTTREGPIVAALRINPSQWTTFKADLVYSTLFDAIQSYAVSGGTRFGRHAVGLTWRTNRNVDVDVDETTSEQAQLYTTIGLWRESLKLNSYVSFDVKLSELLQQRHILTWQGKCLSFDLEYRESKFFSGFTTNGDQIVDRDYRFSLTLRNVGTFLDFSGSVDGF